MWKKQNKKNADRRNSHKQFAVYAADDMFTISSLNRSRNNPFRRQQHSMRACVDGWEAESRLNWRMVRLCICAMGSISSLAALATNEQQHIERTSRRGETRHVCGLVRNVRLSEAHNTRGDTHDESTCITMHVVCASVCLCVCGWWWWGKGEQ